MEPQPKASRQRGRVIPNPSDSPDAFTPSVATLSVESDALGRTPTISDTPEPVKLEPAQDAAAIETNDDVVVDLQARDSESDDEDDVDLEKLRARQAAIAARQAEEVRQKQQRVLLIKNGVDAKHPEYLGFIPSDVINGILVLAK